MCGKSVSMTTAVETVRMATAVTKPSPHEPLSIFFRFVFIRSSLFVLICCSTFEQGCFSQNFKSRCFFFSYYSVKSIFCLTEIKGSLKFKVLTLKNIKQNTQDKKQKKRLFFLNCSALQAVNKVAQKAFSSILQHFFSANFAKVGS